MGTLINNPKYKRHNFDGDGMILSLAFKDGRAYFRNRFVRTDGFVKEQEAGRPLFRNSFSRGSADGSPFFNPFDLTFKNVANTGVLAWGGQLYALWEAGLPYAMDPTSLATSGESRMGGALKGTTFAAHYRITTEADGSRRWVSFSTATGFGGSAVTFYEFGEDGGLLHETVHKLENTSMVFIHDMLVSEHYYCIILGPIEFSGKKFATEYVFSKCSIAECLTYNPDKPGRVVLVPRPGRPSSKTALVPRTMEIPPCFVFHHVNAFEPEGAASGAAGSGEPVVVIDTVAWDSVSFEVNQYTYGPDYYTGGSRSHLVRLVVDPAAGSVTPHRLLRRTVEFASPDPRATGRPYGAVFGGCDMVDHPLHWGPIQGVFRADIDPQLGLTPATSSAAARAAAERQVADSADGTAPGVKTDVWFAGARRFPGEPLFVPRPGLHSAEGEGWVLVAVHNADTQTGELVILDAQHLSKGPVATIRLPHRLPAGLHGSWHDAYLGPDPQAAAAGTAGARFQELASIRAL
ncbi:hypothetical protein HXX76_003381 [Chlamydomonas incerta]|uniref:Uncharacterized protein n=1 Tax=Chlamydomonas incerta TaxID=51695 RepID=A0A835TEA6_CHLIN|nr:hypothetical protein HXX76_003381 [Chlamydomonas incerta]|eukprot:KAG2441768.1 hypothetical protein HXX76_003381 [Chlamydomonas incerta]